MRASRRCARDLGLTALVLLGVAASPVARTAAGDAEREAGPRATLVLGDRPWAVGVVGELIVAVRVPAGHRVLPIVPARLVDAELVHRETELQEHGGGGWLHRTRLRIRPLAAGPLSFPSLDVDVEAPSGERTRITLPERVFEVDAVLRGPEDGREPRGLRGPIGEAGADGFGSGLAVGVAVGAVGALVLMAPVAAWRRRRRSSGDAPTIVPTDPPLETDGATAPPFAAARAALDRDPRLAASLAAGALRALASARFRVDLRATTTEELRRARPSRASATDGADVLRLLERLDATRFPDRLVTPDEVGRLLEDGEQLAVRWSTSAGRNR